MKKFFLELENRPLLKKTFGSFSFLISERMIRILIGLFIHAQIARYLGPDNFGKLNYILRWVGIFATIPLFGLDEIVVRDLIKSKNEEERNSILMSVVAFRSALALFGFLLLVVSLFVLQPQSFNFALLILLYASIIFMTPLYTFELPYFQKLEMRDLFKARIYSFIGSSILKSLGCFLALNITYFLIVTLIENLWVSLIVMRRYLRDHYRQSWSFLRPYITRLAWVAFPLFLSSFVLMLDQRVSLILLERLSDLTELGHYTVSQTLVDLLSFIPLAISTALYPSLITSHHDNNETQFKNRLQLYADIMIWLSYVFILGFWIFAEIGVHILYGDRFPGVSTLVRWTVLTTLFSHMNLVRIKWFTIEGKLNDWLALCGLNLVLSFALQSYLIPIYHAEGAVWGYLGANILSNFTLSLFSKRIRKSWVLFAKSFSFPVRVFRLAKSKQYF